MQCTIGLGQCPRSWGIFDNLCFKSNVQSVSLLLTVSDRKKLGQHDVLVAPQYFCWGPTAPPDPPGSHTYAYITHLKTTELKNLRILSSKTISFVL